ncbi:MAG: transaldolase family protein, partial [Phormidesmis sp.]
MSLLSQLKEMTVVVADTGDIGAIEEFTPRDTTTNPSLITTAAGLPQYQSIVDETLQRAKDTLDADAADKEIAMEA